ncbi:hypothetical protein HPULCUR_003653 [Helicostylum pulchrum]|uniref:Uncharacterized protein n=1 Tax=Helicostylum pulchrum TaxID=562976 RepID=A0ABP9XU13_9FUNG
MSFVHITNLQEFEQFYSNIKAMQTIETLVISNIELDIVQIQQIKNRLPNTKFTFNEPEQDEEEEVEDDEHDSCACHRHDRYE